MGLIRTIAAIVLSISFVVFVALFGRLPLFRKTPIGVLHRLLLIHFPRGLRQLDHYVTGGRIYPALTRTGDYLFSQAHPIVLIFFVALQSGAEVLFIPSAWIHVSVAQRLTMLLLSSLPYITLYLCTTTSSNITSFNHSRAMLAYPYDYTLFHPNHYCRTCKFLKPPRSKHCSLCKACVQKQDHHCIWVNNCVGRNNYIWFLLLLVTTSILLLYGAVLGHSILSTILQNRFVPAALTRGSRTSKKWSTRLSWSDYVDVWLWAISMNWQIGAVTMLAVMAFPLSTGFLVYHVYLLWAGMTTNESGKWADWREDIADGLVYRAALSSLRMQDNVRQDANMEPDGSPWPTRSKWWVMLTQTGGHPTKPITDSLGEHCDGPRYALVEELDTRWEKVHSMSDIENIYDLGFLHNLKDVLNRG